VETPDLVVVAPAIAKHQHVTHFTDRALAMVDYYYVPPPRRESPLGRSTP